MQVRLLRELWRVARKGIFVTTPNRWFPMEFPYRASIFALAAGAALS